MVLPRRSILACALLLLAAAAPSELDALFSALKAAPGEAVAAPLEARIAQIWQGEGGPAAGLLLASGLRNLEANAADEALADFDAAIVLAPRLAEAYARRALARFETGDYPGAVADVHEALVLDPRHFSAFAALSKIAEARADWKGALAAWQQVLAFSPRTPGGAERLNQLRRKALGEKS